MGVVRRAIQWIDDPAPLALATMDQSHQKRLTPQQNRVTWIVGANAINNQLLGSEIAFGDQIDVTFGGNWGAAPVAARVTGVAGHLNGKVKQAVSSGKTIG